MSRAAKTLGTSQPAISRQISALEEQLGGDLLIRHGNRILGLSKAGTAMLGIAKRMLQDEGNLKRVCAQHASLGSGKLIIATTHLFARYALQRVIKNYIRKYPNVPLHLRQGNPIEVAQWINDGTADIGVNGGATEAYPEIAALCYTTLQRAVITDAKHPLLKEKVVSLEMLCHYPLITLDQNFPGGRAVINAFNAAQIKPNIRVSAADTDVIKTYVELGLGIAILPSIAYHRSRDINLRAIDVGHLFKPTDVHVALRRGTLPTKEVYDFVSILAPQWSRRLIEEAIHAR